MYELLITSNVSYVCEALSLVPQREHRLRGRWEEGLRKNL
jgi:hypothetical protein